MTSDSGRGGCPELRSEIETRDPRAVIFAFLSLKPRPAQGGRDCEKSLTETAAVATHCVLLPPPQGPRGDIRKTRVLVSPRFA